MECAAQGNGCLLQPAEDSEEIQLTVNDKQHNSRASGPQSVPFRQRVTKRFSVARLTQHKSNAAEPATTSSPLGIWVKK